MKSRTWGNNDPQLTWIYILHHQLQPHTARNQQKVNTKSHGHHQQTDKFNQKTEKRKHQTMKIPSQYQQSAIDFYRKWTQHPMRAIMALICAWITIALSSTIAFIFDIGATTEGLSTHHCPTITQATTLTMVKKGKASKTAEKRKTTLNEGAMYADGTVPHRPQNGGKERAKG